MELAFSCLFTLCRYHELSLKFYTVLMSHADDLEAVSLDEALIDVTSAVSRLRSHAARQGSPHDPAKDFAESIRVEVKQATGCESQPPPFFFLC
jgi:DNA repair protein REV1